LIPITDMSEIASEVLDRIVARAVEEDCGVGDLTTQSIVAADLVARAELLAKEDLVLAGWPVLVRTFQRVCPLLAIDAAFADGRRIEGGTIIGTVRGLATKILTGERVALNFLQRLSGIATLTRKYVDAIAGTGIIVLDTRKTTPGLRILEKYAVRVGGGSNHRFGLFDGVLIKENHIVAAGGIGEAVRRSRKWVDHLKKIEVEVTSLEELDQAVKAGADVVLLDNMPVEQVREAVAKAGGRVQLEVSGGIQLDNIRDYAQTGVEFISVGALTHSARAVDISLELHL
jgi:nicotinate-nucleotide pyrophosphorylase (carboxylating)